MQQHVNGLVADYGKLDKGYKRIANVLEELSKD